MPSLLQGQSSLHNQISTVGIFVGRVGFRVGSFVGNVGRFVGAIDVGLVGCKVGDAEGCEVGDTDGVNVGE